MSNKIFISVAVVICLVVGYYVLFGDKSSESDIKTDLFMTNDETAIDSVGESVTEIAKYSEADVFLHNSKSDCWTIINDDVYNLTEFINKHPGGDQKILQLCGKNGSIDFNRQHGDSNKQEQTLSSFKIGILAK